MLHVVVTSVCVISGFHVVLGLISIVVGIVSSIKAEVWLAHSVSPIWSGGFFFITGILGIFCARRKTSYVIMCFTAFSVVSMVTAVVSIQLLRLGLVNHTTDGHTFQKQNKDMLIIVALAIAGSEILVCLVSTLLSCRVAKVAKEELCKRREGMFHVKAESDENDNDVMLAPVDCEEPEQNSVDPVEIHVVDENGEEVKKDIEEGENIDAVEDSEHLSVNNEVDTTETGFSEDKSNSATDTKERDMQDKTILKDEKPRTPNKHTVNPKESTFLKEIKSRAITRRSRSKEIKKPMQIFTVLEEEISDVSDIETPRT